MNAAIEIPGLTNTYGRYRGLDGLDLDVRRAEASGSPSSVRQPETFAFRGWNSRDVGG